MPSLGHAPARKVTRSGEVDRQREGNRRLGAGEEDRAEFRRGWAAEVEAGQVGPVGSVASRNEAAIRRRTIERERELLPAGDRGPAHDPWRDEASAIENEEHAGQIGPVLSNRTHRRAERLWLLADVASVVAAALPALVASSPRHDVEPPTPVA